MDDSNDENVVVLDAIDEPVTVDEAFTDRFVIKFWHDAAGVREVFELSRRVADLVDHRAGIGR